MGRPLRYLPPGCHLVEVTNRTIGRYLLLSPSQRLREVTLGALGRAQRLYGVRIHAFVVLSNHYHLLVSVDDVRQLAAFVGYFESKLAREVVRLTEWDDVVFPRRYHSAVVSDEEAAQVGRFDYILSNSVKEHLVAHPCDWPGASSARALLDGRPLVGLWLDRTGEYRARSRNRSYRRADFEHEEVVVLTVLPCWQGEDEKTLRQRLRERLETVIEQAAEDPDRPRAILRRTRPTDRPRSGSKRTVRAPWFHCASRAVRRQLTEAYSQFLAAYRDAARALRRGCLTARFPDGCFPPPRAFVPLSHPNHD